MNSTIFFQIVDESSGSSPDGLGDMKIDIKTLISATDMMMDQSFTLDNSATNATLKLRLTLRVSELMFDILILQFGVLLPS